MDDNNVFKRSAYLYGLTEIKAHTELWTDKKVTKKSFDKFKFHICPQLRSKQKISKTESLLRYHSTPNTLVELCATVVNKLPLPAAFNWTGMDVIGWIDKLGFPQYRNTFHQNFINGHSLIFVDASVLSAMNITDFSHIQTITKSINELYGLEIIRFNRSISLPPRYPLSHFNLYHGNTGPTYHFTKPTELFRKMKMLRPQPTYDEHWQILEKWLQHKQPVETERIGYAYRRNLYKTRPDPCPLQKDKIKYVHNMEDLFKIRMSQNELRKSWILDYLKRKDSIFVHNRNILPDDPDFSCNCDMCFECMWGIPEFEFAPRTLDILRKKLYKKYELIESQYGTRKDRKQSILSHTESIRNR